MGKKRNWISGLFFLVLPAMVIPSWADDPKKSKDFEVYTLGEVVVSADKVKDIAILSEVTAEDIKATNSHTVAEALANTPGIRVSTGRKNEPNVYIHGFDQSMILVLIDGVPYYETNFGKLDLNQIPTDNVAKIEITKGSASVLYGANALGGVINIITKTATEKPFTGVTLEAGENQTYRASVTNGMKAGIFSYWLNYSHQESKGWNLSNDYKAKLGTITMNPGGKVNAVLEDGGTRNNSDQTNNDFWAKFGLEPQKGSAYFVNLHFLAKDKGAPASTDTDTITLTRPAFSQFARIPMYQDWGIDLDGKQKITDQLTLKAKFFYHNHVDDYTSYSDQFYRTAIALSTYQDYFLGGSFFVDYQASSWDILRMSMHYKGDSHKERSDAYLPYAESFSYTGSWGLENEFNGVKNLSIVAGISYDWFNVDKAEKPILDKNGNFLYMGNNPTQNTGDLNPMIGATYKLADAASLFGSIARKSRFPTLGQLYSSSSGNPNLNSEKSINYTLGASRPFKDVARAELAFFYHDITDLISRDGPGPTAVYRNYANARMQGFELSGEIYPVKDLILKAAYTYNDARDTSPGRVVDDLTFVPKNKVDASLQYDLPWSKTRFNLTVMYMGDLYSQLPTPQRPTQATLKTGDYFLTNFKVSQVFCKSFEAYVALNNIFDINYETESGFPGLGRNFWVGVSAKF
ncbi:MAG TPA: TonB-dependent receptor [Thermodesulfobacteriota bacterium]|nr:TonB-dependent receptor [Thermodesulfobacteriota bacterium]